MKPQFILAADQSFFDSLYPPGTFVNRTEIDERFAKAITPHLVLRQREMLETDESYRQLLPYVVIRQIDRDSLVRFFAYRRTNKVGEQRLAGKVSIGFGGHIDAADVVYGEGSNAAERGPEHNSIPDLLATLYRAAYRELDEELQVEPSITLPGPRYHSKRRTIEVDFAHSLILHHEGVQRVHAGILMFADASAHHLLKCREDELETVGFLTARELLDGGHGELEVWSQLFLESIAKIG